MLLSLGLNVVLGDFLRWDFYFRAKARENNDHVLCFMNLITFYIRGAEATNSSRTLLSVGRYKAATLSSFRDSDLSPIAFHAMAVRK